MMLLVSLQDALLPFLHCHLVIKTGGLLLYRGFPEDDVTTSGHS